MFASSRGSRLVIPIALSLFTACGAEEAASPSPTVSALEAPDSAKSCISLQQSTLRIHPSDPHMLQWNGRTFYASGTYGQVAHITDGSWNFGGSTPYTEAKKANQTLIETIQESLQIADEGKRRRVEALSQLELCETELRKTLAAASARNDV